MTTINHSAGAVFRIAGKDATEQTRAITGTIGVSDYAIAYIAKVVPTADQFCIKARPGAVPAGVMAPVDVVVNASDDRGTPLPPQVFNFQIQGPALPPPATHVIISEGPFGVDSSYSAPPDPGSGTIGL